MIQKNKSKFHDIKESKIFIELNIKFNMKLAIQRKGKVRE